MDTRGEGRRAGAVVALKPLELAKSRLVGLADPLRQRLAWTMAVDTLSALSAAVDRVVVVGDQPALQSRLRRAGLDVDVLAEPFPLGMNGALSLGADALLDRGCAVVLACVGDLPALRSASVARVLAAAQPGRRCFLADASAVGTTMLVARGTALEPHFQGASADAHRTSGAVPLTDEMLGAPGPDAVGPDARLDVDTETDLIEASRLGLGAATAALLDPATGLPGRYVSVTVTEEGGGSARTVIASTGHRLVLPLSALQDGVRHARPGQRLHAVATRDAVLAAWL
jgi:2-phospho-L-lactate guanylyltransferase